MKKIVVLSLAALIFTACGDANQPTVSSNAPPPVTTNSNAAPPVTAQNNNNSLVISSHSTDKTAPSNPSNPASSSSSNSPTSKPVDVSEMTAKIEKSGKELKAKPTDAKLKETLASAYFDRAFALTEAAQYRAALGDFRKGLKLNPNNKEARDMHDEILDIFKSIGREPPKEGEEPPPLPIK